MNTQEEIGQEVEVLDSTLEGENEEKVGDPFNGIVPRDVYSIHRRATSHVRLVQTHYLALGMLLVKIQEEKMCHSLGYDSFSSYCASPPESGGLGLPQRTRQVCMQVARRYILDLGCDNRRLSSIPRSNLATLVPVVNEDNLDVVLHDAEFLGNRDVRELKLQGKYGGRKEIPIDAELEPEPNTNHITCPECQHVFSPDKV